MLLIWNIMMVHINNNASEEEYFEVEKVLKHKKDKNGLISYFTKWKDSDELQWVPAANFDQDGECIKVYERTNPGWNKPKAPTVKKTPSFRNAQNWNESKTTQDNLDRQKRLNRRLKPVYFGQIPMSAPLKDIDKHGKEFFPMPEPINENERTSRDQAKAFFSSCPEIPKPPSYKNHIHNIGLNVSVEDCLNLSMVDIISHIEEHDAPNTRKDMLALPDKFRDEYIAAEEVEMQGIKSHGTFESVVCPPDRIPITCRWVYDLKRNKKGEIVKFKARLVVQGFKQREGVDFQKTFSSTAQLRTFRVVVALALEHGFQLTQYDISNAFLNGKLEEELYMEWPPGYPSKDKGKIVKLLKGLYGLKQASRLWQQTLYECLTDSSVGLQVCKTESGTMYLKDSKGNCICIVLVYVDDLIICCHDIKLR